MLHWGWAAFFLAMWLWEIFLRLRAIWSYEKNIKGYQKIITDYETMCDVWLKERGQ